MRLRIASLALVFCAAAAAQSSSGYVYVAPGGATSSGNTSMTLQMGVGGDFILGKGIGVGAEVGAVGPRSDFSGGVLGLFSPNASYHFVHSKENKFDPYVTGGYTMFFRAGHENLFNFGAGANYWFARRVGLKMEFRDQVYTQFTPVHFWGVHLGLAFR
ncbi:MAG TPA: outer membrane beta-barrel protein [Bryobacteraceae bacterium]|nr:outer membrane beta-barrel protein [Bryobacteraceae bacterium]